jgi:hypothetical protein
VFRYTKFGSSVTSSVLIDLTNQVRVENGLRPLFYNQALYEAATMKGADMVTRNYFAHFAPDGTSPWHWIRKAGYSFLFAGENLAINFRNSHAVTEAWMNSPKHRANILDSRYEDIGIATIVKEDNEETNPSGKAVIFVVQLFGKLEKDQTPQSFKPTPLGPTANTYEKILFDTSYYIKNIYTTLVIIIVTALLLMIFIEIKKQHPIHILYGVLLLCLVVLCLIINNHLM